MCVCIQDPICAGHGRYLRQSGKACGILVPASAVVRSHSPCVIPVTTQVVWVAFVCLIIGVENKTVLLLIPSQDLRLPKCFSSDPQHKTGPPLISLRPVKAQLGLYFS